MQMYCNLEWICRKGQCIVWVGNIMTAGVDNLDVFSQRSYDIIIASIMKCIEK